VLTPRGRESAAGRSCDPCRYRDWIGTRGEVTLCSAPSVTLGSYNTDRTHGYFHMYELAPDADGGLRLNAAEQVTVA